jgi:hypothetical protein
MARLVGCPHAARVCWWCQLNHTGAKHRGPKECPTLALNTCGRMSTPSASSCHVLTPRAGANLSRTLLGMHQQASCILAPVVAVGGGGGWWRWVVARWVVAQWVGGGGGWRGGW